MSALQIKTRPFDNRPSDAEITAAETPDREVRTRGYGLADLRAAVLADHGATVAVRVALGVLLAVAVVLVVAGIASQFVIGAVAGGVGVVALTGALISLAPASAKRIRR